MGWDGYGPSGLKWAVRAGYWDLCRSTPTLVGCYPTHHDSPEYSVHLRTGTSIPYGFPSGEELLRMAAMEFTQFVDRASKRVVVVHEASDETLDFDRARKILQSVDQIVMVGF